MSDNVARIVRNLVPIKPKIFEERTKDVTCFMWFFPTLLAYCLENRDRSFTCELLLDILFEESRFLSNSKTSRPTSWLEMLELFNPTPSFPEYISCMAWIHQYDCGMEVYDKFIRQAGMGLGISTKDLIPVSRKVISGLVAQIVLFGKEIGIVLDPLDSDKYISRKRQADIIIDRWWEQGVEGEMNITEEINQTIQSTQEEDELINKISSQLSSMIGFLPDYENIPTQACPKPIENQRPLDFISESLTDKGVIEKCPDIRKPPTPPARNHSTADKILEEVNIDILFDNNNGEYEPEKKKLLEEAHVKRRREEEKMNAELKEQVPAGSIKHKACGHVCNTCNRSTVDIVTAVSQQLEEIKEKNPMDPFWLWAPSIIDLARMIVSTHEIADLENLIIHQPDGLDQLARECWSRGALSYITKSSYLPIREIERIVSGPTERSVIRALTDAVSAFNLDRNLSENVAFIRSHIEREQTKQVSSMSGPQTFSEASKRGDLLPEDQLLLHGMIKDLNKDQDSNSPKPGGNRSKGVNNPSVHVDEFGVHYYANQVKTDPEGNSYVLVWDEEGIECRQVFL